MREKIVLASASPRRLELLRNAGYEVELRPGNVPEIRQPGETALTYVARLAREKAGAVAYSAGELLLAADTVVEVDGHILEKPSDAGDAAAMLASLAGRWHRVHTGVALRTSNGIQVDTASTGVLFLPMTAEQIREYAATGEPMDKAGAYAIQGIAGRYIDRIDGCYFNVVGLPISLAARMIATATS